MNIYLQNTPQNIIVINNNFMLADFLIKVIDTTGYSLIDCLSFGLYF
jgi:hypothetical protein